MKLEETTVSHIIDNVKQENQNDATNIHASYVKSSLKSAFHEKAINLRIFSKCSPPTGYKHSDKKESLKY